jgi:choline dehydrogenase-like flavoprotein
MAFLESGALAGTQELTTDVCIVGAGAAGLTIAGELARAGREVCVLESGGMNPDEQTQALCEMENVGYPVREGFMSRARYFGGSCNLWAGRSMRYEPSDMAPREWVPHSGWPIAYAELASYYPAAARILRLPALHQFDPAAHVDRMSPSERRLFAAGAMRPTVSLWAKTPVRFGARYRPLLRRAPHVRVLLNGNVTGLNLAPTGGRVDSVDVSPPAGSRIRVRARTFVLACGALENARLLLASRDRHPEGLGDRFDVVGRYFMDHPRAVFGRLRTFPGCRLPSLRGLPLPDGKVQIGIALSPAAQARDGLLDHYVTLEREVSLYSAEGYQSAVQAMKVLLRRGHAGSRWNLRRAGLGRIPGFVYLLTAKELVPHGLYRAYRTLHNALDRNPKPRRYVIVYFCEQPPDPESRVTLSDARDPFGVNKLRLQWRLAPDVIRSVMQLQEILRARLGEAGIGTLEDGSDLRFTDASHHMGTTRMSDDPRTGAVDRNCRLHGVDNLFVAGSSVFPSAGHKNPTLTIVALALRLADHLKRLEP